MRKVAIQSLSLMVFVVGVSGVARAAEIQRVSFSGSQAVVGFFGSAQITCADGLFGFAAATGSLSGAEQIFASTGSPPSMANGVFVQIDSYFNTCTGVSVGGASGGITDGFTAPDKKLTSATMAGTTLVQDFGTGAQISVTVDVDVIGTGQITQSKGHNKTTLKGSTGGPIQVTMSRSANGNRTGTPEGTISVDGVAIAPEFFFSILVNNSSAQQTITK
jgi:hypothetical protein